MPRQGTGLFASLRRRQHTATLPHSSPKPVVTEDRTVRQARKTRVARPLHAVGSLAPKPEARPPGRKKSSPRFTLPQPDGRVLVLRRPLRVGGLRKIRIARWSWRSLVKPLAGSTPVPEYRVNGWLLVLAAKKIPHMFLAGKNRPVLYVPALYEGIALHEILAFEQERPVPVFVPPVRHNIPGLTAFFGLLLLWHALRWGMLPVSLPDPPFPSDPRQWVSAFGLDVYRFREWHQWWRAVTALTLHASDDHILGNVFFGLLFFIPLCRRAGFGLGLVLATVGGVAGNVCNGLFKEAHIVSLGFSTALFSAVGALCALTVADVLAHQRRFAYMIADSGLVLKLLRRLLVPIAAGMAFLGLLGGGSELRTDYAAHIWGFCCGLGLTLITIPLERRLFALGSAGQARIQGMLCLCTFALYVGAWFFAL